MHFKVNDHKHIEKIRNDTKKSICLFSILVALIDTEQKTGFTINVKQKDRNGLVFIDKGNLLHQDNKGEELTITLSTICDHFQILINGALILINGYFVFITVL